MNGTRPEIMELTGILLPSILITLIGMPLGLEFGAGPKSGLEGLGPYVAWIIQCPFLFMVCILANIILLALLKTKYQEPIKFRLTFFAGLILPAIINILYWANINTLTKLIL